MNNRARQIIFARERLRMIFCSFKPIGEDLMVIGWLSQGAIKQIRDAGGEVLEW